MPKGVGGNGNAAEVQLNNHTIEKAAHEMADWIENRLVAYGVGMGAQCLEVLSLSGEVEDSLVAPNYLADPQDFVLDLDDEDLNSELCSPLDRSLESNSATASTTELREGIDDQECSQVKSEADSSTDKESILLISAENPHPWINASDMAAPDKTAEVLWTGYLARFGHS